MFGKSLEPIYKCKVDHRRRNTKILRENNVKLHDEVMGVWRKLKEDNVKVIEDLDNKRVKREEDPRLQNRLTKSHIAMRKEVRSLISGSPASQIPQPKFMRDETQLIVGKTRYLIFADISRVEVHGRGSTG